MKRKGDEKFMAVDIHKLWFVRKREKTEMEKIEIKGKRESGG